MFSPQVSMLLTGCMENSRLDHVTFINSLDCDVERGFINSDDDDCYEDKVANAVDDSVRKVVVPNSLRIDRR